MNAEVEVEVEVEVEAGSVNHFNSLVPVECSEKWQQLRESLHPPALGLQIVQNSIAGATGATTNNC